MEAREALNTLKVHTTLKVVVAVEIEVSSLTLKEISMLISERIKHNALRFGLSLPMMLRLSLSMRPRPKACCNFC